jgi:spore germination protein GerM
MKSILVVTVAIALLSGFSFGQLSPSKSTRVAQRSKKQLSSAIIEYLVANESEREVKFTYQELKRIQKNPEEILSKLKASNVTCPEKRERVDQCTWVCGDGSKVRTCNDSLQKALATVWR